MTFDPLIPLLTYEGIFIIKMVNYPT